MILNTGYSVTTENGTIKVEVNNGIDTPGVTISSLGREVLEIYFDNTAGYLVVKPTISLDNTEFTYKLDEVDVVNNKPSISGLVLNGELGEIRVLPFSDEAFQGITVHAMGLLVGQVEFNQIDKALNVYIWDEENEDFKVKYSEDMPMMA